MNQLRHHVCRLEVLSEFQFFLIFHCINCQLFFCLDSLRKTMKPCVDRHDALSRVRAHVRHTLIATTVDLEVDHRCIKLQFHISFASVHDPSHQANMFAKVDRLDDVQGRRTSEYRLSIRKLKGTNAPAPSSTMETMSAIANVTQRQKTISKIRTES